METRHNQPHPIIKEAFTKFEFHVRTNDARLFKSTTLADVREATRIIERDQAQRRCLRNMKRIEPLFECLEKLGGAVETLCQGCFIWMHFASPSPITNIADEYTTAFERLLEAYHEIAQHLPRFDRLSIAFQDQEDFQTVLAGIYSDVLEFHSHAYSYLRRGGGLIRLQIPLPRLTRFTRLEVVIRCLLAELFPVASIRFCKNWREAVILLTEKLMSLPFWRQRHFGRRYLKKLIDLKKTDKDWQLRDTLAWLDLKGQDREQEDLFENRSRARKAGTCEWILQNAKIRFWLDPEDGRSILWLRGKPGSGKTTLATFLTENVPMPPQGTILYCLCSYGFATSETSVCSLTFRSFIAQLIRKDRSLLPFVYDHYVKTGVTPSTAKSRVLLKELLVASTPYFSDRTFGPSNNSDGRDQVTSKILICSRETRSTLSKLRKVPQVVLTDEKFSVSKDIATFAKEGLSPLTERFPARLVEEVESRVVQKADGMPPRLQTCHDFQKWQVKHILSWLALSYRPLKWWEVCDAIVFHNKHSSLNDYTKLQKIVLDICKPLIEEHNDQTISLVHFSVREYVTDIGSLEVTADILDRFLLHEQSGPYLHRQRMHIQITQACIRYLMTYHPFTILPPTPKSPGQVAKGFHDIFPYVNQYWTLHLMDSFKETSINYSEDDHDARQEINYLLVALLGTFHQPEPKQGTEERCSNSIPPGRNDTRAPCSSLGDLPEPILRYLAFKRVAVAKRESFNSRNGPSKIGPPKDPMSISSAFSTFQHAFEALMSDKPPVSNHEMGVSETDLEKFRSRHASAPYFCCWTGCVWASTGFRTSAQRSRHEMYHEEKFRCSDPTCDFAIRGFSSRQALRKHNERYHTSLDNVALPKFPTSSNLARKMRQMLYTVQNSPVSISSPFSFPPYSPRDAQDFTSLKNSDGLENFDSFLNTIQF
ncbi:uncharacterized protein Z518_03187 [Rhinocladiella mackenziei CBS 650.93]|uniref:C2H2-type domain-containing protein n=1 Tax=Rhinocladiella mackenziei CBS 650.93 TaxID=1442369 RepID=A0A0D2IYV3_9EURO|nr:uncharacterized protein Z518_03187 [Rhinocladiella mackenziei CBS 650.93]KIX08531.1 hypothetical protein Z518_03187 [Rhinocladiella mackenziei CBS 650.93]